MGKNPLLFGNNLYFFSSEIVRNKDKFFYRTTINKADRDGTNRSVLTTIENLNIHIGRQLFYNGVLYFNMIENTFDENGTPEAYEKLCFCSYDIKTNTFTNLGKICEGYSVGAWIYGLWNNSVYLSCSYSDVKIDISFDGSDSEKALDDLESNLINEDKQYKISDKLLINSEMPAPIYVGAGYYLSNSDDKIKIYSENGNEFIVPEMSSNDYVSGIINNKVFFPDNSLCYDITTQNTFALNTESGAEIIDYSEGFYIARRFSFDENKYIYEKFSEAALMGDVQ